MNLPKARTADLIEQDAGKELLIYDLRISKAFSLNETSRNIFEACHGETSFGDLKRKYKYTDDLIFLALDELKKNDLIEGEYLSPLAGIGRREAVKRVGLATMAALPLIASITAPKAVHAASNQQAVNLCEEVECPYAEKVCQNDGTCNPATGDCGFTNKPSGTPCDDGDASTTNDMCDGSGVCVGICVSGFTDCSGIAPRCKDLQTDPNNCGACGNLCAPTQSCVSGSCISVRD